MESTETVPVKPKRKRRSRAKSPAVESDPVLVEASSPLEPPTYDETEDRYEAEAAMLNDDSMEPLHGAPSIGGYTPGYGVEDSRTATWAPSVGRPVSPPLWEHAAAMPEVQQLAVWLEIEGRPEYIGRIGARSGLDEFVGKFRSALVVDGQAVGGEFICRPLDSAGRPHGSEFRKRVSSHHPSLRSGPVDQGPAYAPQPAIPAIVEETLRLQREELAAMRAELREDRERIALERAEVAQERVALASNAASGVQAVSERMMASDAERQRESLTTLTGIFSNQMEMQRQAADERQREHERSLEREAGRRVAADAERTAAWDRERERERERAKEAESERDRRLERYKADQEAALQREREHAERMVGLMQREADSGGLGGVTKLLDTFGFSPSDALEAAKSFMTSKGGDGDADGVGTTLIKTLGDAWGKTMEAQGKAAEAAKAAAEAAEDLSDQYPPMLPGPQAGYDPAQGYQPPPGYPPQPVPQPVPAAPVGPVPANVPMPLPVLKKVRKALLNLFIRLRSETEDQWMGVITLGLSSTPESIEYLRHVSISGALREAGADDAFIRRFLAVIEPTGLVPADIPR